MHPLLARQLRRHLGVDAVLSEPCRTLLHAVDDAYAQAESDQRMLERSMDLMSQELTDRNRELKRRLLEKEEVEAALRRSEASLARAQRVAGLGHWVWELATGAITWSEQVHRIFGVDPEQFKPTVDGMLACVHPDDRPVVAQAIQKLFDDGAPYTIDYRILLAGGAVRHVNEQGELECDSFGRPLRVLGTVLDISRRKAVEEALLREKSEQAALIDRLEEAHNQLLQSEKMASIGQLAAGVAHEINNPIGYINSNLGTLRRYVGDLLKVLAAYEAVESELTADSANLLRLGELKREVDLDYIRGDILALLAESGEGTERVRRIVQDLKDFSHVDEGEWVLADLHHGLESTLNVVHNELKYKADVVREYGRLPLIRCLPSQLNQVLMNLLVNAAQAIETHGTIGVRTGSREREVWVEIADNGKGIPEDIRNKIFDPFFTTKPVGKGTGLGLSISYGIVKKHGGRIEVESEVGAGSVFRVVLPVAAGSGEANHG